VFPCAYIVSTDQKVLVQFCNVATASGTGTYIFNLRSAMASACIYTAQGRTLMVADGGFVTDVHDDNVQVYGI
jgi:hypothetical protein